MGLYYPCSENKDADQLRGYREADLRLCFRICKSRFSHDEAHIVQFITVLISLNPLMTTRHFDESNFVFRSIGSNFSFVFQFAMKVFDEN